MQDPKNTSALHRSFSFYLLIFMVALVLFIVGILSASTYLDAKNNFEGQSHNLEVQTEQNVEEAFRLMDKATTILDNNLNDAMEAGLIDVQHEYLRSGSDPSQMDLDRIQARLGEGYDIYVIDEEGVIVRTTYAPELGQDFKSVPYFFTYLTKIRESEGFFPDRVVHEFLGLGQYRKYAYMPTPDHRYVLELGLGGPAFDEINRKLDDYKNIKNIMFANPYVESYATFNVFGLRVSNNTAPPEPVAGYLREVIRTQSTLEVSDPAHSTTTRFLYIDLKDDQYGSDPSRIVMITYNTRLIQDALNRILIYHLVVGLLAIIMGCVAAFFLSRRMALPIRAIVRDVEIIAGGDLDHRIPATKNNEFSILGQSINAMVDSLKSAFQKMKDEEIFRQEMIDRLPVAIFVKRADDGRYVYWNETSERLFGIPHADAVGKTDADLFPSHQVEAIRNENAEIFKSPGQVRSKIISNKSLGGKIIHVIIVPVFDSQGRPQYVMGISEDVSYQNINLKMELLSSITRQDVLDNLSVIASHLERAQLINTHEEMQQFINKTVGSIESIRNQIAYMRSLQDQGIVSPKWQHIGQAFDDAVSLLPRHSAGITSNVEGYEIYADPLLPRIFFTLLENSLRNSTRVQHEITLSALPEKDELLIVYTDNGYAIPEDEKEKVFDVESSGPVHGLFLIRELLGFTGITIRETGVYPAGVRFEIRVPAGKFRVSR